ncbi:acyltransferase family protein [Algirhabdus cladophorae]|uniref:acyltransferase family protein n=1 Tax=Algirhabdus cladophorae TaxID=3377108 RepID=UPI003B847823
MSGPALGYRPDIDGIRAIAVALVVVFHFELIPMGRAGFIGVDVFFVLSGFLITRIILAGLTNNTFSIAAFYTARVRRLYPALLTVLSLYLLVGWFVFLPDMFAELATESLFSQLYIINFYFWQEVNYFGLQAKQIPLLHMWSLAVEEQFYIFYPLVLMLLYRYAKPALLPVLIFTVLASFALGWFASGWKPWAAFYLLPTRAWELGAGGVLAIALARTEVPHWLAHIAGWAGLALIGFALFIYTPLLLFPGWFAVLPVLGAMALILAGSAQQGPTAVSRMLALSPMVWLGRISYPLYLVHWPIIIVLAQMLPEVSWTMRALGLAGSVVLSWAIMLFIETPIRQKRRLNSNRAMWGTFGGTTAALITISAVLMINSGAPGRFDPQVSTLLTYADDQPHAFKPCDWPRPTCLLGAPDQQPTVALFGDSHANAYATALDMALKARQQTGVLMFGSTCMPVLNMGGPRCDDFTKASLERLETNQTIKTVFLASIWRQANSKGGLIVGDTIIQGPALHAVFQKNLVETVTRLQDSGKTVVLIDPLFATPSFVPKTMARNLAFGTNWPVDVARADHDAEFSFAQAAFDAATDAGATRISPLEIVCSETLCSGTLDGTPLYTDNSHIRVGQSLRFKSFLSDALPRP